MSVLGEAGGFKVRITIQPEYFGEPDPPVIVVVSLPEGPGFPLPPHQARALAALLVTAADEAERGKPQLVKPGGKRLPPGPLPEVNPQCGYTTIGPANPYIGQAILPNGDWKVDAGVAIHGINGLEIPPGMPIHTVVCIDGKARALDADGKIVASNVPGDPGVEPEKGGE